MSCQHRTVGYREISACLHGTDENRNYSAGTVQLGTKMSVPTLYRCGQRDVSANNEQLEEHKDVCTNVVQLAKEMSVPAVHS